ncbi:MAG: hypothetical protein ACLQLG_17020 [Thermoguttaceae bacterium]
MWARKTGDEIANEPRKVWWAFSGPTLASFMMFVGGVLSLVTGPKFGGGASRPSTAGGFLFKAAVLSLLAWLFAYVCQIIFRKPFFSLLSRKVVICNNCYRVKSPDGNARCGCGGEFEDFARWKWVDD